MRAMILAAGLGTRLRPLTDDRPKALVTIGGRTMLEITLERLRSFGIRQVIVNTHHYAGQMRQYLADHHNFGMSIEISHEEVLLDTGGGLKQAAHFFLDGNDNQPFLVHNVDVLSTIDLNRMVRFHIEQDALATLAVQQRETSRSLLFDEQNRLCGRETKSAPKSEKSETGPEPKSETGREGHLEMARPAQQARPLAFSGIHVLSPRLFAEMEEEGVFSIISTYMRLAARGENIVAFSAGEYYWRDLGKPASVAQAAEDIRTGAYPQT